MPTLMGAAAFITEASAKAVKITARTTALINAVRRALWLKEWGGDMPLKTNLCCIPFTDYLFRPGLEQVLDRSADRKKGFPQPKKKAKQNMFSPAGKKATSKAKTERDGPFQRRKNREDFFLKPPRGNTKKQ